MIQDFKFAVRQLFKAPGFTIAATIVLALGIGANTAVFSLVNTLLFAPPSYANPHEVVQLFSQDKKNPKTFRGFSYPIMREGSIMLFCGIVLGLLLAGATGKILSGMLYEVGALDPIAFTAAPLLLACAALVATWLPARRAASSNPVEALRYE